MSGKAVAVTGLSPKATKDDLLRFFTYSGEVQDIKITPGAEGDTGATATVTFVDADSVGTAVLLSGAIIVDQPVSIEPTEGADAKSSTQDALAFIDKAVSQGLVVGESFYNDLKTRAKKIDEDHGIVKSLKGATDSVLSVGKGAVNAVTGEKQREPTTQQYMYGNQPQWGPPPEEKKK